MNQTQDCSRSHDSGQDTFLPLLVALIVMLVLAPLAAPLPLLAALFGFLVQLAGLFAVRHDRSFRTVVAGGFLLCLPLRLATQLLGSQYPGLFLLTHVSVCAYFALLSFVVLVRVIAHQRVTSQTVIGAICGYLLIGYVFTHGYLVLVFLDPSAITLNGQSLGEERVANIGQHMAELFYFSFITLTTVGYGDIVPASPIARSLVVVEILTGQLYLAAFVARLVGAMDRRVQDG
jgi:Ion channel